MTTTMRAYPVTLACRSFPARPGMLPISVVLRDIGPTSPYRYVTHCRHDEDPSSPAYYWGHYHETEHAAWIDFCARCNRYT